jgi:hypothetical protein
MRTTRGWAFVEDASAGLSPALAFEGEARRRQDSRVRPGDMVRMMIPSEGAAKNIAMSFGGLAVDGSHPSLIRVTEEVDPYGKVE